MNDLINSIQIVLDQYPVKIVISKPADKNSDCKKIIIQKHNLYFQAEKFIKNQVFHENMGESDLASYLNRYMSKDFLQLNAFTENYEHSIKISKKGKVFYSKNKLQTPVITEETHDHKKNYIFQEGQVIEPLVDMGIFTKEGKVINSMYDKYRQINRFIEVIDDVVSENAYEELSVIDFGCGKGYLTFLLYYYLVEIKKIKVTMIGLDLKEDVIENCNKVAQKYGYDGLKFRYGDIKTFKPDGRIDMVISLHACDTATDHALFNSIQWNAKMIFSIPCCQHEINGQISSDTFSIMTRYGIIQEHIASAMTDAIRGNLLTYCGYKVQLLEIIAPVHTPKNILIRAIRTNVPEKSKQDALDEVIRLNKEFNLQPTMLGLLQDAGLVDA
jgi:SAM-dependent methyltransferase